MSTEDDAHGGRRVLWFLFVLAWVLRAVAAVDYERHHPLADRPVIDEAAYERWGLEIASGDWLGDEVFFQEPLYPYFLGTVYAVVGWSAGGERSPERVRDIQRTVLRQVQCFLGALTVVLLYLITARLFGRTAAVVAGLGLATYRPLLVLPGYLLKPNLLLPILAALVLLALRSRSGAAARPRSLLPWLAIGILAGAGALLRGNVLLLLPVIVALPFLRALLRWSQREIGRAWTSSLTVFVGISLCLAPVALRNYAVGGVFAPTTSGVGTNVYGGNNEANLFGVATELDWVRGIPEYEFTDWKHEAERRTGRELDAGEVSEFWLNQALLSLREQPLLHLGILWNKLRLTLGRYEVPDNRDLRWDAGFLTTLSLPFAGYGLWGWLGLAGALLFFWERKARSPGRAAELLVLYLLYLATIVLTVTSMRARLALVPLLLPFAGHLIAAAPGIGPWLRVRLGNGSEGARVPTVVTCLLLAAVPVFAPVFDRDALGEDLAERDFNHAVYLLEAGDFDRAGEIGERLAAAYPATSRVETLLAEIDTARALQVLRNEAATAEARRAATDQVRGALARLRAVVIHPNVNARERFRARKLAGRIQLVVDHDAKAAERHFRAALTFDPTDYTARLGLANALYLQAVEAEPGDEREAKLHVCASILEGLIEETPSADLSRRLELVREASREMGD